MTLPELHPASRVTNGRVLYVGAYGGERRGEQWLKMQLDNRLSRSLALIFEYKPEKIKSRKPQLQKELRRIGITKVLRIEADVSRVTKLEEAIDGNLNKALNNCDEVIIDVTSMSKLLILLTITKLRSHSKKVRVVYSELERYEPTREKFEEVMAKKINVFTQFPTRGIESVVRAPALSSIRMQGQPVTLIAFTSFNEQLILHILGTVSPHRLVLIGSVPPRLGWREMAMQQLHESIINEYRLDNLTDENGRLINRVSTLHYQEAYRLLLNLYKQWGSYERIIAAATGSKMQTLGLALVKQVLPDIHIEYPTPKSYYIGQNNSSAVAAVHEITFDNFKKFIDELRTEALDLELSEA